MIHIVDLLMILLKIFRSSVHSFCRWEAVAMDVGDISTKFSQ